MIYDICLRHALLSASEISLSFLQPDLGTSARAAPKSNMHHGMNALKHVLHRKYCYIIDVV